MTPRRAAVPLAAALCAAVVGLAGCTASGGAPPSGGTPGSGSAAPGTSRVPAAGDPAAVIDAVRLRPADTGADTEVELQTGQLAERPSLDLCFAPFGSEARRVARGLYSAAHTEGEPLASNDVVIYADAAAARQAVAEARRAVAGCPSGVPRQGGAGDQPPTAFRYAVLPPATLAGLQPGAFAVTETAAPSGGQPRLATRIVQQRGRIVVIVDGYTGRAAALALARVCATRLGALPASAL